MEQGPFGALGRVSFSFIFFFFNISGCRKPRQAKSKLGQTPAPMTWPLTKTHDAWHRPGPCNQTRSPNPGLHHPHVTIQAALDPRLLPRFRITGVAWQQVHCVVTTRSKAPEACGGRGRLCAESGNSRPRPKQPRETALIVDRSPPVER